MKGSYDSVAPFYDRLSGLVYGAAIVQAQIYLVYAIPENSRVLIVGGGTGQILEEISKKHVSGLQITYVDISKEMIALAKKRNAGNNTVFFINQSIFDVSFQTEFDIVLTAFFFDNFSNSTTKIIFNKIDSSLKPYGLWLFADFQVSEKNNLWQKLLLKVMYLFFRTLCGIEASDLPDTTSLFQQFNYRLISRKTFYKKFIYSTIYLKT